MMVISEELKMKIANARKDYKAGKGVVCKTFEDSLKLLKDTTTTNEATAGEE